MSGTIPQSFIDDIIFKTDLVELIDQHVPLKKTGSNFVCCCPFHQEKSPSFNVNQQKQFFYCFGCGTGGNAVKFVMLYLQLSFPETIEYLAQKLGIKIPDSSKNQDYSALSQLDKVLQKIQAFYRDNLYQKPEQLVQYLKSRKLNSQVINTFQLGYAPPDPYQLSKLCPSATKELLDGGMVIKQEHAQKCFARFKQRLMFPIINRKGTIIGFAGRVIDAEHKPKYLNSPETKLFHKQKELYGLYNVLQANNSQPEFILVVEGYLDVISLFQFGIPNAVATMGTATSTYHLQTLTKYTNTIIFCFDGDKAGKQAAWRALENAIPMYNQLASVKFLFLPDNYDPDTYIREFGANNFKNFINKALCLHVYFAQRIQQEFGNNGTQKIVLEVQKYLQKLENGPGKELLLTEIAKITRLDPYRLNQWLDKPLSAQALPEKKSVTPLRIAIALIIQRPELFQELSTNIITEIQALYPDKFAFLFNILRKKPQLQTASLIEYFQDNDLYEVLNKLVFLDHQIHEEKQLTTLNEIFEFLIKQSLTKQIDELLSKLKHNGLDADEKLLLQKLLTRRQIPGIHSAEKLL